MYVKLVLFVVSDLLSPSVPRGSVTWFRGMIFCPCKAESGNAGKE